MHSAPGRDQVRFRDARLDVDTAINADGGPSIRLSNISERVGSGWPNGPILPAEIDRYVHRPAQSLGYKIKQLSFIDLRERERQRLGRSILGTYHHGFGVLEPVHRPLGTKGQLVD